MYPFSGVLVAARQKKHGRGNLESFGGGEDYDEEKTKMLMSAMAMVMMLITQEQKQGKSLHKGHRGRKTTGRSNSGKDPVSQI